MFQINAGLSGVKDCRDVNRLRAFDHRHIIHPAGAVPSSFCNPQEKLQRTAMPPTSSALTCVFARKRLPLCLLSAAFFKCIFIF